MNKNVASQKVTLLAIDTATNLPKTGDAANLTFYVSKDDGSVTALGDTSASELDATNAPGLYTCDLTQAETNANKLVFSGKSSTSGVRVIPMTVYTRPANFSALSIASAGGVATQGNVKKGAAFPKFMFLMTDSTNHNPVTGKTVTATIGKDGGTFGSLSSADTVTEVGNGIYEVDLDATDTNANCLVLRFTATGCDDTFERIVTTV